MNKNSFVIILLLAIIVILSYLYFDCHKKLVACTDSKKTDTTHTGQLAAEGGIFIEPSSAKPLIDSYMSEYSNIDDPTQDPDPIMLHKATYFSYKAIDELRLRNKNTYGFVCYSVLLNDGSASHIIVADTSAE